jgi:glycosyltransferase involved in cell wall biosynthesis
MNVPKVSIGLPVWNGEKYLRMALDSILRQDYPDFELIISDNASTDATQSICQEYAARDARIRYFRNEKNIGASGNYNRVFELSRGEFFKWISHDDECAPSFLKRCLEIFESAPDDVVLVCSSSQMIDESGQLIRVSRLGMGSSLMPSQRLASLIARRDFPHALWGLIRSNTLRQTRLMGIVRSDDILLSELALLGNFVEMPEGLQRWRIHRQNALAVCKTPRELLLWHDPTKANNRIILPNTLARDLEYFRVVRHVPLSATERMFCYGVVSRFACVNLVQECGNRIRLRTRVKNLFKGCLGNPQINGKARAAGKHDVSTSKGARGEK